MRFRIEQHFDAPPADVERAFLQPEFLERLGALAKVAKAELVDEVVEGSLVHRRIRYRFTGQLNAAVRRVVDPARLTWIEESTLDRATHHTTWRIAPDHYAAMIRCSGSFQLADAPRGATRRTTDGDIRVNVRLVGGRVERAIVSGLEEHAAAEEEVINAWLNGP